MSNTIHLRGTINHINVHPTSLFMVVREDRANGAQFQVKAFCPQDMKQNPEAWAQNYHQWAVGMRVVIEGCIRFEPEKALNQGSNQFEIIRHPVTGRDMFQPYVWAYQMDILAVFDIPQQHKAPPPAARSIPQAPARAPLQQAQARQPQPEPNQGPPDIPWNMGQED